MSSNSSSRSSKLARVGLLLEQSVAAKGHPPGTDELWDWMHGSVSDARSEEILSHLAFDEDLYDQWRELREALSEENLQNEKAAESAVALDHVHAVKPTEGWVRRLLSKLRPKSNSEDPSYWPTGAFSYVVLMAMVALLVQPLPPLDPWQDWSIPKAAVDDSVPPETRQMLDTILTGARVQLADRGLATVGPYGGPLPNQVQNCPATDQACISRDSALRHLGSLAMIGLLECQSGESVSVPADSLVELENELEVEPALAGLLTPMRRWAATGEEDSTSACAAISTLVSRSLQGQ